MYNGFIFNLGEKIELIISGSPLTTFEENNIFGTAKAVAKIDWSLKLNRKIRLSLFKSMIHRVIWGLGTKSWDFFTVGQIILLGSISSTC